MWAEALLTFVVLLPSLPFTARFFNFFVFWQSSNPSQDGSCDGPVLGRMHKCVYGSYHLGHDLPHTDTSQFDRPYRTMVYTGGLGFEPNFVCYH